jgi:hypothetical protein
MRKMITAGAAGVLLAVSATTAYAWAQSQAPDATPACGSQCFELSSLVLGLNMIQNAYVPGDNGANGKVGQLVTLKTASNGRPNEDFIKARVGTLDDFCGGPIPAHSYVCLNYPGSYPVFESDWAPFGNTADLCVGLKKAGTRNQNISLRRCGASAKTLWVVDLNNATSHDGHIYTPLVNASDPNFSHPLVLTVDTGSRDPGNRLRAERLNLLNGNVVRDSQEFTLINGPVA